jgi:tight adherence protein B
VLIQREVGGALAEILDTIAEVIRERLRIQGEVRTLTTQGKLTGYMLACMPIALGTAIHAITTLMSPGVAPKDLYMYPLLHEPVGHKVIMAGLFWQFLGFLIIKKITNIDI